MEEKARLRLRVSGIVQGVGFRPFVYALAGRHGLVGFVGNDSDGVFAEVEGPRASLALFLADLEGRPPPLAVVESVLAEPTAPVGEQEFRIVRSVVGGEQVSDVFVSPDTATCEDCLAELTDPDDRRYRYPFTNCTNCGPRFTIVMDVPYDRSRTTMKSFALCEDCAREYKDPADRRFHAQPVCCPACGPRLCFVDAEGHEVPGDPVETAARWLRRGAVVAVKGLGGYHLAALAGDQAAVSALRSRKHREDKPFALLVPDLEWARSLVTMDSAAEAILADARRPVVLLPRRAGGPVADAVAPGNRDLGVMLPYTPLHHLLAQELGVPCVLTSGNVSDEPIAYRDEDARTRLGGIADGFLLHDRPIHIRTDDSVVRVFRGRELPIRRSRGRVPAPLSVPWPFVRPLLACGAELKNTFCLARDRYAFVSHHIGDLENYETLRSYVEGVEHVRRLFGVRPEVVAHDLHPDYLSTKYAQDLEGVELVGVQHHHAHVASCLADNQHPGPVIGVAMDGLGYGGDGTFWGGELLVADLAGFERVGCLTPVPMPGGAAAVREPWRMAVAYLDLLYGDTPPELPILHRHEGRWEAVVAMARSAVNAPPASSAGRLFDAVAAIVDLRDSVTYEGQAAIQLEQRVDPSETHGYFAECRERGEMLELAGDDLVRGVVDDLQHGIDVGRIAARFHLGLADLLTRAILRVRDRTGLNTVALSGGVFQNVVLLEALVTRLEQAGLTVLLHHRVPPNDGGISLGQAVVAAARDRL